MVGRTRKTPDMSQTAPQIARRLGVRREEVVRAIVDGRLGPAHCVSARWMVDAAAAERYIAETRRVA